MTTHWTAVLSLGTTGARAIFECRSSQTALCIRRGTRKQARKCGSKRYLGRWAFMATGPIEQVRRERIYTYTKRRDKRFHYSFVYGTPRGSALCKDFRRRKAAARRQKVATSCSSLVKNGIFGHKAKRVEAVVDKKNFLRKTCDFGHRKLSPGWQ